MPQRSDEVHAILSSELRRYVTECEGDILGSVWFCPDEKTEEQIPLPDGSARLFYRRSDDRILDWYDYTGETNDTEENDEYFARISAHRTIEGVKPEKHWMILSASKASDELHAHLRTPD